MKYSFIIASMNAALTLERAAEFVQAIADNMVDGNRDIEPALEK